MAECFQRFRRWTAEIARHADSGRVGVIPKTPSAAPEKREVRNRVKKRMGSPKAAAMARLKDDDDDDDDDEVRDGETRALRF